MTETCLPRAVPDMEAILQRQVEEMKVELYILEREKRLQSDLLALQEAHAAQCRADSAAEISALRAKHQW
ncbi:hypothetical protein H632_c447p0, partial [Helicosporidium sp. ATCC 50920]